MSQLPFIAAIVTAEVLGMLGISSFAGLLPEFQRLWHLSATEAGWISGLYYAGYVAAVPVLTALTDRVDPRRIYLASTALGGIANLGFALTAHGFWSAVGWQVLSGLGLAGTYMPGLKALTDRVAGPHQSRALASYTSGFSLGIGGSRREESSAFIRVSSSMKARQRPHRRKWNRTRALSTGPVSRSA